MLVISNSVRLIAQEDRVTRITGRVLAPAGQPLTNARVLVQSDNGKSVDARSDTAGRFAIAIRGGRSGRLVISMLGYTPFDTIVALGKSRTELGDVQLRIAAEKLKTVRVDATFDRSPPIEPTPNFDIGSMEQDIGGVYGSISDLEDGGIAASAALARGVSLLGTELIGQGMVSDAHSATLNGMRFSGTALPRDAGASTRVTAATPDVSRGGFSGIGVSLSVPPGQTFPQRTVRFSTSASRNSTSEINPREPGIMNHRGSARAAGSLRGILYYNAALDVRHRSSTVEPLLSRQARSEGTAASDSVPLFTAALANAGFPIGMGNRQSRTGTGASLLARFDLPATATRRGSVLLSAELERSKGEVGGGLYSLPQFARGSGSDNLVTQIDDTRAVGARGKLRSQVGLTAARTWLQPTSLSTSAVVPVKLDYTLDAFREFPILIGSGGESPSRRQLGVEVREELAGAWRRRHFARITGEMSSTFHSVGSARPHGVLTYESPGAFVRGAPSEITVSTGLPSVRVSDIRSALSAQDIWKVSRSVAAQYGVRVDWTRLADQVAPEHALRAMGISPRIGLTWEYGGSPEAPIPTSSAVARTVHRGRGVVRAGLGEYRGNIAVEPFLRSTVSEHTTGKAIHCSGAGLTAQWNPPIVPATLSSICGEAGASTIVGDYYTQSRDAALPVSRRLNASWSGLLSRGLNADIDATVSVSSHLPSSRDVNFAGNSMGALEAEGGRPLFAPFSRIDPVTGKTFLGASRLDDTKGRIIERTSTGRARGWQVTAGIAPAAIDPRVFWSVGYALSSFRDFRNGFDAPTAGDPRLGEWSRSAYDIRHQISAQAGIEIRNEVAATLFFRSSSGKAFTPLVGSDINGDGFANDRAFVSGDIAASLGSRRSGVRHCLRDNLDQIASRGSCRSQWTVDAMSINIFAPISVIGVSRVGSLSLMISNPMSGLETLIHGGRSSRGWGGGVAPDPVLLHVTGYNPASRQFRYAVNSNFGRPAAGRSQTPFTVSVGARVSLSSPIHRQLVDFARSAAVGESGSLAIDLIKGRYVRSQPDVFGMIAATDELDLDDAQLEQLESLRSEYFEASGPLWEALARYMAQSSSVSTEALVERVKSTQHAVWQSFRKTVPRIRAMLSAEQYAKLPFLVRFALESRGPLLLQDIAG